jgi:hypothetical protein
LDLDDNLRDVNGLLQLTRGIKLPKSEPHVWLSLIRENGVDIPFVELGIILTRDLDILTLVNIVSQVILLLPSLMAFGVFLQLLDFFFEPFDFILQVLDYLHCLSLQIQNSECEALNLIQALKGGVDGKVDLIGRVPEIMDDHVEVNLVVLASQLHLDLLFLVIFNAYVFPDPILLVLDLLALLRGK